MKKTLMILLVAVMACMAFAGAKMECSIKADCTGEAEVLRLSDPGGGHAGTVYASGFANKVCCSGVPGMIATTAKNQEFYGPSEEQSGTGVITIITIIGEANTFMVSLSNAADGHASKTEDSFPANIYLESPTTISCTYSDQDLSSSYDTCLFSLSDASDAHVGDCSAYANKYWCSLGETGGTNGDETVCRIENIGESDYTIDNIGETDCTIEKLEGLGCAIENPGESGCTINNIGESSCTIEKLEGLGCAIENPGESVCTINNIYWGVVDENGNVAPVETVGVGMPVLMVVETTNCQEWKIDFEIFKGATLHNALVTGIEMSVVPDLYGGGKIDCSENGGMHCYGLGLWITAEPGQAEGDYTFKVKMNNPANLQTIESEMSAPVNVNGKCIAVDPWSYAIDECYFDKSALEAACGAEPASLPDPACTGISGARCHDTDCDGVDDCIDQIDWTAASVDRCTGVQKGTAGCVANIDCTNLAWGDCFRCEAGEPCDTQGNFQAGDWIMQRCGTDICPNQGDPSCEACKCSWIGGSAPPGCSDDQLNQWNSRFKACIVEEEFPVFDHWNIVAVLMILTGYYALVLYRKGKSKQ